MRKERRDEQQTGTVIGSNRQARHTILIQVFSRLSFCAAVRTKPLPASNPTLSPFTQQPSTTRLPYGCTLPPLRTIAVLHTMPPAAPTALSTSSTHFSLHHPIKLMTLRPNTWFALETLIEFVVVSYLTWALFYLVYLWVCGALWMVKGLRYIFEGRRRGKKWWEERRLEKSKETAEDTNQRPATCADEEMDGKSVEGGLDKKRAKDTDNTGRERSMTV